MGMPFISKLANTIKVAKNLSRLDEFSKTLQGRRIHLQYEQMKVYSKQGKNISRSRKSILQEIDTLSLNDECKKMLKDMFNRIP